MADKQPDVPEIFGSAALDVLDQAKFDLAKARVEALRTQVDVYAAMCAQQAKDFVPWDTETNIHSTPPDQYRFGEVTPIVIDDQPPTTLSIPSKVEDVFKSTGIDLDKAWVTKPPPAVKEVIKEQDLADPPPWTWSDPSMQKKIKDYLNTLKEEEIERLQRDGAEQSAEDPAKEPVDSLDLLRDRHKSMLKYARRLLIKKNRDYGSTFDIYSNLRAAEVLGINPGLGVMIRMMDKISRLRTYIANDCAGLEVDDESAYDSLIYIINYAVLLAGLLDINPTDD